MSIISVGELNIDVYHGNDESQGRDRIPNPS